VLDAKGHPTQDEIDAGIRLSKKKLKKPRAGQNKLPVIREERRRNGTIESNSL
jgi:hypothetical protein